MSANNQSNNAGFTGLKARSFGALLNKGLIRQSRVLSTKTSVLGNVVRQKIGPAWEKFQDSRDKPISDIFPDGLLGRFSRSANSVANRLGLRRKASESIGEQVEVAKDSKALIALSNERALVALENEDNLNNKAALAERLPLIVIVGGFSSLCILAILTTGATQQVSDSTLASSSSSQQIAYSEPPARQAVAQSVSPAPVQQLAASVSPVVFEASGNTATAGSRAALPSKSEKARMLRMLERENALLKQKMAELIERNVPLMPAVPQQPAVVAPRAQNSVATVDGDVVQLLESLQGENANLKQKMTELESETLSLNSELLQLELSLADASRREERTVYNFVNVPLGGEAAVAVQPEPQQFRPPQYVNNELYSNNSYSQDVMSVPDLPPPEMAWDYGNDSSSPNTQMYQDQQVFMNGRPDPYFDPQRQMYYHDSAAPPPPGLGNDQQLYGAGADMQYGPNGVPAPPMVPGPPRDLRGFPPVN
ncbi:MAG: hypothetical protein AB8B63_25315 [Granulosicoccus sp.]